MAWICSPKTQAVIRDLAVYEKHFRTYSDWRSGLPSGLGFVNSRWALGLNGEQSAIRDAMTVEYTCGRLSSTPLDY